MTDEQRSAALVERRRHQQPPHSVPHRLDEVRTTYLVTAACFEHAAVIGKSPERMAQFESELVGLVYATINYVLHNAVKHGYVDKWTQWPYCNASDYVESVGREKALQIWKSYPINDYGNDWDPAEL
ncbi:MAG: hypothetical protein AAGD07_00060 [Planctomycetota bacterium]